MPTKDVPANEKLEGHDEVLARLLRSTPPEDILRAAGVDRLLGSLTPDQRILVTPVEVLRGLSEEYLRTLPEHLQAAIRARLHHRA